MYLSWARWTWSFPSWLRARMAKISNFNCMRSILLTPNFLSRLTFPWGLRLVDSMTVVISSAYHKRNLFSNFSADEGLGIIFFTFLSVAIYTTTACRFFAKLANSSMERSKLSIPCNSTPISRSLLFFLRFNHLNTPLYLAKNAVVYTRF